VIVTGFWDASGGLLSGVKHDPGLEAGALTSAAFGSSLGIAGEYIVSISVIFFGFSTIIAWYVYGTKCFEYLFGLKYVAVYGVIYITATFLGTVMDLSTVWAFADTANALMMILNLLGLLFLYKVIRTETQKFFANPVERTNMKHKERPPFSIRRPGISIGGRRLSDRDRKHAMPAAVPNTRAGNLIWRPPSV